MNPIRFISSYTEGTIYKNIMDEMLIPSLEKFNLPYHIFKANDYGSWKINSRQRPLFIKEAMKLFPDENIVWIDADARVLQYPELLFRIPSSVCIGVHYMQWVDHYGRQSDKDKVEILDGTSYYKNCEKMIPFMDEWIQRSVGAEQNHRLTLGKMIEEKIDDDYNIFIIPRSYCYIIDKPDGSKPNVIIDNPVIAHYQASRMARKNLYTGEQHEC